jgi:hypothetical protein
MLYNQYMSCNVVGLKYVLQYDNIMCKYYVNNKSMFLFSEHHVSEDRCSYACYNTLIFHECLVQIFSDVEDDILTGGESVTGTLFILSSIIMCYLITCALSFFVVCICLVLNLQVMCLLLSHSARILSCIVSFPLYKLL